MIAEISTGAILGYLAKEGIEYAKAISKSRQLRKQAYFEKKVEVTIASIKGLSAIVIGLHNCALSIKWLKKSHEIGNWGATQDAVGHFLKEYGELHKTAKDFPHEITLFYDLPNFDTVFGQFNEMLENEMMLPRSIQEPVGDTTPEIVEQLKKSFDALQKHFGNIFSYIEQIEEKERLMERCLEEVRRKFRENG